ncbi:hypothetical protein, unlikely [Trypanosoma congolense IL3000]|uniref:Uncharacterized protein n=1 Tax=Trypanosoma congolense (strain IL3000) TaxID=1068625 RepID=F9WEQ0_TRYCI|nr:hypothetical protein, unlikely [Trypanosoma congolense IL3000]
MHRNRTGTHLPPLCRGRGGRVGWTSRDSFGDRSTYHTSCVGFLESRTLGAGPLLNPRCRQFQSLFQKWPFSKLFVMLSLLAHSQKLLQKPPTPCRGPRVCPNCTLAKRPPTSQQ